jgi:hypothetical protein
MSLAAVAVPRPAAPSARHPQREALTTLLQQLRDVITLLPPSVYLARPAARVSGSVGEHVRHCLDHITALAACVEGDELSYDSRRRGTMVETDPLAAVNEIERLFFRLDRLAAIPMDRHVRLSALVDKGLPALIVQSTVGRELAFVIQHTIHHFALIAVLLEWQGFPVAADFGLAPSTARSRAAAR